ncbi:preprotein translocase subunit SecE [Ktedonosporobacter rubrisoli]|uniref:Protein translocase subunit SecE n=1 Tax=Ktedonosporobacter rubrisoli TaxID=2509675 RepID=A0A4P6JXF1_KTERU|nr:preprotein translocase subunit SecE [Ktedonosporobacter rubrisoli]QBD80314.1 preprotein translocase subunit SecE [Ktedonosporobacter rubrisoli]
MASKMAEKKKNASRSQVADVKARNSEKEQSTRSAKAASRDERKESSKRDNRSKQRSSSAKAPSPLVLRFRNSAIGRFIIEAYYELRHKVTWPTFEEARNMTIAVIALSAVIGGILAIEDFGLYHLVLLISGGK